MKKNANKAKGGPGLWPVAVAALLFVIAVGFLARRQLDRYEQGVLEVYADRQDDYVRLVLEQVRLTERREGGQADLQQVLATLDASADPTWTLSPQTPLVLVKEVPEVGEVRGGFIPASPDQTQSARDFVDGLGEQVSHTTLRAGPQRYIASGAGFTFRGAEYRVCLLTNIYSILDHGAYQRAKLNLITLALIALAVFAVAIECLAFLADDYRRRYRTLARKQARQQSSDHPEDL